MWLSDRLEGPKAILKATTVSRPRSPVSRRRRPPASDSVPSVRLEGSTVLLTGATGGIGRAIAHALDARGARVLLSARRAEALDGLRQGLDGPAECLDADLAHPHAAAELADRAGAVDVLVANAALPASGALDEFTPDQIDRALDVNLRAPIQLTRALLPHMLERGSGHLVFLSSLSGKVASVGSSVYSATKFGLRAGTLLGSLAPLTAARVQRKLGSVAVSRAIAEGQRGKR